MTIYGTGTQDSNYTVVMDLWLQGARDNNMICPRVDKQQTGAPNSACAPASGIFFNNSMLCFEAAEIDDPAEVLA